jgi:hypothetical protein
MPQKTALFLSISCGSPPGELPMKPTAASEKTFLPKTREPIWSFSVRSLIALSTAVACGCTLAVRLPGLGMLAGALLVLVTIRTLLVVKRWREKGIFTSPGEKAWLFLRSLVRGSLTVLFLSAGVLGSIVLALIGLMFAASVAPDAATIVLIACLLPMVMLGYFVSGLKQRFHHDVSHHA